MPVEVLTAEDLTSIRLLMEQAAKLSANNATQIAENVGAITRLEQTQKANTDAIAQLTQNMATMSGRVDELACQVNRWMGATGERLSRIDAMIDRYDGVLAYLMRQEQNNN